MCTSTRISIAARLCLEFSVPAWSETPELGSYPVVFQTNYGDIEFGFLPTVAPQTVDKGFVAQVADVARGRMAPINGEQKVEAEKTIVGEFSDVKHVRGILSMGSPLSA